ncbi:uncharacterized protein LOC119366669 [Triticum dicoccoides]|uniref:uncharacterized protein LOC119366669 n=1 Tax=Triticum dicoccoides TaxID=85692 RepID=UPI00188F4222|nr:uncharacterized protein LOC119366669 [Triticum dicoccoides]
MSGGIRRLVNLGVYDGRNRVYSLRRLDLSKMGLFHRTAEEAAADGKLLPTLTPAKASAPNRRRICKADLAAAEAAAPTIRTPASELVIKSPEVSSSLPTHHRVHFLPTASEDKVVLGDRANRMFRFDGGEGRRWIESLPSLHEHKHSPLSIAVPPSDVHLHDGQDGGDMYIIDRILHPDKSEAKPQFEALVWRAEHPRSFCRSTWHCDILSLPQWIIHQKHAYVCGHALVGGDTICFSIAEAEGTGTYCFHIASREWSKAGDWVMPFQGKAEYVLELGLWFGESSGLPCAANISGVVRGEEPLQEKLRIWVDDDLPEEWQPSELCRSKVISLGLGRFIVVDFLDAMVLDKDCNEMVTGKQFALFTGMEVVYDNGRSKGSVKNVSNGAGKDNDNYNSDTKGMMRGLRMVKHKSKRYMFNVQQSIDAVL